MPPPMDFSSKPNAGARGVPTPGLPSRPARGEEQPEEDEDAPAEEKRAMPPPPPMAGNPDEDEEEEEPQGEPIRIAMPVSRSAAQEEQPEYEATEEHHDPEPVPASSLSKAVSNMAEPEDEPQVGEDEAGRGASAAAADTTFGAAAGGAGPGAGVSGKRALIQYDYEKAEDNELELREGEYVTNIEMVDDDWWMGQNSRGERGLFPSNYVELVEGGGAAAGGHAEPEPEQEEEAAPPPAPRPAASGAGGKTATAQFEYEAAEDNEIGFPEGATINNVVSPSVEFCIHVKWSLIRCCRASLMMTGGWVSTMARKVFSRPTTSSSINKVAMAQVHELRHRIGNDNWRAVHRCTVDIL